MGGHDGQEGAGQASGIVHSPAKGDEGSVHTESVCEKARHGRVGCRMCGKGERRPTDLEVLMLK